MLQPQSIDMRLGKLHRTVLIPAIFEVALSVAANLAFAQSINFTSKTNVQTFRGDNHLHPIIKAPARASKQDEQMTALNARLRAVERARPRKSRKQSARTL